MYIHDIYVLGESDSFEIKNHGEATVNLELEKVSPCYHTLLSGQIVCKDTPIMNATVIVMDVNCSPLSSTITDENGYYEFRNLLKPGKYKVVASAIGYNVSNMVWILINQDKETKLSIVLKKSLIYKNGIVYGKVWEAGSRKPIEDAVVYLKTSDDNCKTIYKTTTNHNGQYLIYNVLPNCYVMTIQKQGYLATEPLEIKIEKYDRISLYFDLIRDPDNCKNTISGMITFEEKPIPNAAVFLYLLDKQKSEKIVQVQETNENGFFLFLNIESGFYLVKGTLQNTVIYENSFTIK